MITYEFLFKPIIYWWKSFKQCLHVLKPGVAQREKLLSERYIDEGLP